MLVALVMAVCLASCGAGSYWLYRKTQKLEVQRWL